MCNCLTEIKAATEKFLNERENNPEEFKIEESGFAHESFYPTVRLYAPFEYTSTFKKKDGSTSKPMKKSISIFFQFCPFCGEKSNVEPEPIINKKG